jgi:ribonuclease-3
LPKRRPPISSLEKRIGYAFRDRKLLRRGLTHCSYANESQGKVPDNEAMEFLGDAILSFVVSDELCKRFPEFREGRLSRTKASLVQTSTLADQARQLNLGRHLLLGRGEEKSGGAEKESLLANTFEALVAAVYLDGGVRSVRAFIRRVLKEEMVSRGSAEVVLDPKSALQERLQALGKGIPYYQVVEELGPDHRKTFVVALRVDNKVVAEGKGNSKKVAQQRAAQKALASMDDGGPSSRRRSKRGKGKGRKKAGRTG